MSNHNWVCFSCQTAVRKPQHLKQVPCQYCGAACVNLGYKIPIPPKSKPKLWVKLQIDYYLGERRYHAARKQGWLCRVRSCEAQIEKLASRPVSIGRAKAIQEIIAERDAAWQALALLG